MKKILLPLVICVSGLASAAALADIQTASIGYAQSRVAHVADIRGVNLKYSYQWDDAPVGLIGSFTWMTGDEELREDTSYSSTKYKADFDYYSLAAGPVYAVNNFISVYGLLGVNINKVNEHFYSSSASYSSSESDSFDKTSVMYGAGVQVNLTENLLVDVGYEGSKLKTDVGNFKINGFNLSIGYRF